MSRSIICGVDRSAGSQGALEVAARLSARLGLTLVVAHVAEPVFTPYAGRNAVIEVAESQVEAAERLLEQVIAAAGLVDAEHRAAVGVPAERLADLADEEDAEMIVVGSRGRGVFKAAFLGSVSNSLVGVARCPVLIVPPGAAGAR